MGANIASPPFIFMDKNNRLSGFEVELLEQMGKIAGFEVEITPAIFPHIFKQLENGEVDFIGHLYFSEQRARDYLINQPAYYVETLSMMALNEDSLEAPLSEGKRVAVLKFSPIEADLKGQLANYPDVEVVSEMTSFAAFRNLFVDKADILITTDSNLRALTENYPQYTYHTQENQGDLIQTIDLHFLTRKDNQALMVRLESALQKLRDDGTYDRLREKWGL